MQLIVVVKALKDLFEISQLSGLRDHNDLEADNSYNFLFKLGALDLALSEGYPRRGWIKLVHHHNELRHL